MLSEALIGTHMAKKLTKALRGKHRWIGCLHDGFASRDALERHLAEIPVKLFDMEDGKCILKVSHSDYEAVKVTLSEGRVVSQTASGKIKLVRERLGIVRPPRKR